ncbi:hypothetical protein KFE25_011973 [Diacronema lutheri]|uniref:V-type proton ATPase subunit F n=1 Tax=Diacronema lutheri TaxID=2081491 RepID=A0A8J5XBZ8_DIALT|nr:hypothetical protein KFE25_011973 [Diacronema lutheri]
MIGDDDTITGMLLAGCGNVDEKRNSNFLVVDAKTSHAQIEEAFNKFTKDPRISILVINQYIAHEMRGTLDKWAELGEKRPAILEVPSKEHPYEKALDPVYQRTKLLLGLRD